MSSECPSGVAARTELLSYLVLLAEETSAHPKRSSELLGIGLYLYPILSRPKGKDAMFEREGWRGNLAISNHAVEETSNIASFPKGANPSWGERIKPIPNNSELLYNVSSTKLKT